MKHTIKQIIESVLLIVGALAIVLATGEASTGGLQVLWTGGCIAVLCVICRILDRMGCFDREDSTN